MKSIHKNSLCFHILTITFQKEIKLFHLQLYQKNKMPRNKFRQGGDLCIETMRY